MSGDLPTNVTVPGGDDQYRKPQEADTVSNIREGLGIASTFLMPIGGSFVEDLISDGRKVDEKDPSWEEIITMVVIPGRPANIRNASQIWSMLFKRMESAAQLLEDGIKDLKSWEGQAGEAYRANLTKRVTDIRALIDKHKSITTSLDKAAGELETAIKQIPIPDDMAHEVAAAQVDFANTGQITNGIFSGGIFNKLLPIYSNKWFDELREAFTPDWAANKLRDWISDQDDKAKAAYKTLAGQHVTTMDGMPEGQSLKISNITEPPPFTPTTTNPTGKPPSIPQTKQPTMPDPKTTDPFGKPDLPGATDPSDNLPTTPPDAWSKPPSSGIGPGSGGDLPGTGLAGAGGGGLSGAGAGGLGAGGLGAGGGLPGGGAGLGAGTAGVGGPGTGMMGAGMAGAGAGAGGRGAGAGRGSTGRSGLGGMAGGGGHGGAGGGDGDEYSTWLSEDEDVWGSDTDAAPPVLGA